MKIVCIHPRFAGLTSHHFNESQGFIEEFARRGGSFELLVSVHAPASIVEELGARAVLDDPTFRMEWSFEERSDRFLAMMHEHVDRRVDPDSCVLITVATQLEAHALTRWLVELPKRRKPWVVILFLSDRWNRSGQAERERQIGEFRKLEAVIASLSSGDARRLIFFSVTEPLAEELTGLLGTPVAVAPLPIPSVDPRRYPPPDQRSGRPRVAVLGGLRAEKGSYLLPGIVRACRSRVRVEFLLHLTNNNLDDDELEKLAPLKDEPHVTVIDRPITRPDYYRAVASADLGLFPYEVVAYRQRASGVFADMVAFGKPAVVTRGTWLAEQIESGHAAGTIAPDLEPDSLARAIANCVSDLEHLTSAAQALSAAWRESVSLSAFVDFMEATIAKRSLEAKSRARWPWRLSGV
jgi:glycosyltransferase involved in cell wall biosynthesis